MIIPKTELGLEPLHAVYRRETCLPAVGKALQSGEMRMTAWLANVAVIALGAAELTKYDPDGRALPMPIRLKSFTRWKDWRAA